MALEGDLGTLPVRELLGWLARRRASGTLSLTRAMAAWQLRLREGCVVVATSSSGASLLGRLLVERGLLEEGQLAGALERSRRSHARLGRTLVRSRLVSAEALTAVLSDQGRRVLGDILAWTEGRFFFDDAAPADDRPAVPAAVDLGSYLAEHPVGDPLTVEDADVVEVEELSGRPGASARRPRAA
jgi:hypothetical protein